MKAIKSLWLLALAVSVIGTSCTRNEDLGPDPSTPAMEGEIAGTWNNYTTPLPEGVSATSLLGDVAEIGHTSLEFCGIKTTPLCSERGGGMGNLVVRTGNDKKVYVTYTVTSSSWFIKSLSLYVGTDAGLPKTSSGRVNLSRFPMKKSFNNPYNVRKFTWVLSGYSGIPTVSAYADLVKVSNNRVRDQKSVWADACTGTRIYKGRSGHDCGGDDDDNNNEWATKMNYTIGACATTPPPPPPPVVYEEVDICANSAFVYFDESYMKSWKDVNGSDTTVNGHLTHGGKFYKENEGRALYHTQSPNASDEAKEAFAQLTALKQSGTNSSLYPPLQNAMNTVEAWLQSVPKLTPAHLPEPPATVKDAITYLVEWVDAHPCPDRR